MHFYLELYIKILLLSSVFWQLIWYFHHQRPVNCTHKYICFGCYSDCVFSVFLHGIIEAFLLWANLYITFTKWQESWNQLCLIAGLLPMGLSISFTQHIIVICYLNTAFCGTQVFHGHILRQCWSLWWQLPVLCNPAPPPISRTAQYFVLWSAMSLHCCQTVNPCYIL